MWRKCPSWSSTPEIKEVEVVVVKRTMKTVTMKAWVGPEYSVRISNERRSVGKFYPRLCWAKIPNDCLSFGVCSFLRIFCSRQLLFASLLSLYWILREKHVCVYELWYCCLTPDDIKKRWCQPNIVVVKKFSYFCIYANKFTLFWRLDTAPKIHNCFVASKASPMWSVSLVKTRGCHTSWIVGTDPGKHRQTF